MLQQHPDTDLTMFVVWEPILPMDWSGRPSSSALGRLTDRRVRQFWDEKHLVADRLARDARAPQPEPDCCFADGILWDLAAVYPEGAVWAEQLPSATVFDGPVVRITDQIIGAFSAPGGERR